MIFLIYNTLSFHSHFYLYFPIFLFNSLSYQLFLSFPLFSVFPFFRLFPLVSLYFSLFLFILTKKQKIIRQNYYNKRLKARTRRWSYNLKIENLFWRVWNVFLNVLSPLENLGLGSELPNSSITRPFSSSIPSTCNK